MHANMTDLPGTGVFHANSPYGVNRKTRRDWEFRLKKKRGAHYTKVVKKQHDGMHGGKTLAFTKALEEYQEYISKAELPSEYRFNSKGKPFKKTK